MDLQKLGRVSNREELESMSKLALVELVLELGKSMGQLSEEVERLKRLLDKDSSDSSKPPSSDLIKRSEKPPTPKGEAEGKKRKPGGQPGHPGKTRKGFGRVDRYEVVEACECSVCGGQEFERSGRTTGTYTIAQLVASLGPTEMLGSFTTPFPAGVETQISPSTGVRRGFWGVD